MSFATSSILLDLLVVGLAGAAIKLMDDYLDYAEDVLQDRPSLAGALGGAIVPYSLVFAVIACSIDVGLAAPLILSAYVVGMVRDPKQMLPLGLPAWMESCLVTAIMWILFGLRASLTAVVLMVDVQLVDDLYDLARERTPPRSNLAHILGKGETALLALVATLAALVLDRRTALLVCVCAPLVASAAHLLGSTGGESYGP